MLRTRTPVTSLLPSVLVLALTSGCNLPPSHGDANAFIVGAAPDVWAEVEPSFRDAMAPTIQTVRNEEPFRITHQNPGEVDWGLLNRFRQVIVIGEASDLWISQVLEAADDPAPPAPTIVQVDNVWARGQQVSAIVLPATGQANAAAQLADELHTILDEQFRAYATTRMYISGRDEALSDSLATNVGYSLLLPSVYRYTTEDSTFRFRNDNPTPTELIREISVTWQTPVPAGLPIAEDIPAWRDAFAAEHFVNPQVVDGSETAVSDYRTVEVGGRAGVEYQGAWVNPPGAWPAGGPFITRVVPCPSQDRLYFLDAWLYAPGKDKYEYMIQLETILDSFGCS